MPDTDPFDPLLDAALTQLDERHLRRRRRPLRIIDATHVEFDGRRYVNFASNNYLGLTHHPAMLEAARIANEDGGTGSGAAPLVTGYSTIHAEAEATIAAWKGMEDALLLPSGYQANHAAIGGVAAVAEASGRPIRFLLDKLAHASLIDAVRGTGAPYRVFPHNGLAKLERLLTDAPPDERQVVVTESIFSMDGDAADLPGLAALKQRHAFTLILDEAHASGVYGPAGAGYAAELGLRDIVDLSVATLSKGMGSIGGVVCGSHRWIETLVNFSRAYLFSTAVPPSVAGMAVAAVTTLREEPERQQRVRALARSVRDRVAAAGIDVPHGDSPIIPIVLGTEEAAIAAAERLRERGLWVTAIRPPTVPRGTSRLRITLSAAHADAEVDALVTALAAKQD